MNRLTLRTRLALVYTAVFVLGGAVLLGVNYGIVSASLENRGVSLATTVEGVAVQALDEADTVSIPAAPTVPTGTYWEAEDYGEAQAAVEELLDAYRSAVLTDMVVTSVLVLGGVTALAALAGWLIAGRPMRRLHRVTEAARTLSEDDLHSRLELTGPDDEFRELGDTFDGMLARLERAFDSQRRFVANASHELRTPLAVQRTALEVPLSQGRVPEDLKPAFGRVLESVERSEELIAGLLLLARSDRGLSGTEAVGLAEVAGDAVALHTGTARARGVALELEVEPADVAGDRVLLAHLARNLVDNALRYNVDGGDGGWVRVEVSTIADRAVLRVANTGPRVRDADALFEPFHRGDAARLHRDRSGSGLGLSIVRSIAEAHGGSVSALPRTGGGLTVTVGFPAVEGDAFGR
ncbi:sensor histidine kinase [Nocardiopsis changdeensis]|uniref:histidine kinase n=1 Tax=Nocardiopsis changdeensis TaxID=2831969 RepID=A0ABX8BKW0_9ACTN|nr:MULTISPECIES: ATP-binding protein [Nocardiopsis]QUX22704.1 HAMP domain-containing protein [Nocardiopsis changdeensis]QYX38647.1 HAMP domain-containing protein [Nocardiopsis sp. MT53]